MTIKTTATVGELAAATPHATRVFEEFGIDYCCGGGQLLIDACTSRGVDIHKVVCALERGARKNALDRNYSGLSQCELADHIIGTHHTFTRTEIKRLTALIQKVVSVHGARHPELDSVNKIFAELADDLIPHMLKEENVLFPYILRLEQARSSGAQCPTPPFVTVRNPLRMMQFEHDLAGRLLQELRRITWNYTPPPDACLSYKTLYEALDDFEQDLHQHIHLENNILFPRSMEMESQTAQDKKTAS